MIQHHNGTGSSARRVVAGHECGLGIVQLVPGASPLPRGLGDRHVDSLWCSWMVSGRSSARPVKYFRFYRNTLPYIIVSYKYFLFPLNHERLPQAIVPSGARVSRQDIYRQLYRQSHPDPQKKLSAPVEVYRDQSPILCQSPFKMYRHVSVPALLLSIINGLSMLGQMAQKGLGIK